MKLIIDIDEEIYNRILKGRWIGNPLADYVNDGVPFEELKKELDLNIENVEDWNVIQGVIGLIEASYEHIKENRLGDK